MCVPYIRLEPGVCDPTTTCGQCSRPNRTVPKHRSRSLPVRANARSKSDYFCQFQHPFHPNFRQKINKISYEGKLFIIQVEWEQVSVHAYYG